MASVYLSDTQGLKPFDCTETAGISARWERWLRAFELYSAGKGVKNVDQKKALLLHTAGLSVQDIYFTLNEEGGTDSYQKGHPPQANVPYERLCFRETSQLANETIEQFVARLRQKAQTCEFGDGAAVDEQIRDQVISKCLSHELRRKLLQKGRALTLPQLREIARSMEESEKQARSIEGASDEVSSEVNSVSGKSDYKGDASTRNVKCFVVEMWDIKLMITDAQREGNSADGVKELDILRLCVKLRRNKTLVVEVEELEDHVDQMPKERMVRLTM
ncbi:hypothetical protein ACROYT_G025359 [Oculina patagonica]